MDKYEKALEQARNYYPDNLFLDTIFPELAGSEDERIRTQLLDFLEHLHSQGSTMDFDVWSKADCANWIVWLEKQKKQKDSERERLMKDAVEGEIVKDISGKLGATAKVNLDGFKFGEKVRVIIVKSNQTTLK